MRYVLNSAVITSPGTFTYSLVSLQFARDWLVRWMSTKECVSTIGYPETAKALSNLTGVDVPVNRKQIVMEKGDEALVFRLALPQGRIDPMKKGEVGIDEIEKHCEVGLLTRRA